MRKSVGIALLSLMISAAGAATVYAAGWQQGAGGWWYEYEDGSYAKSGRSETSSMHLTRTVTCCRAGSTSALNGTISSRRAEPWP